MQRIVSTYRYVNHLLTPDLLAQIAHAGASKVEVFCASSHFSYRDTQVVRELAGALEEYQLQPAFAAFAHRTQLRAGPRKQRADFDFRSRAHPAARRRGRSETRARSGGAHPLSVSRAASGHRTAGRRPARVRRRVQLARTFGRVRQAARSDHRCGEHAQRTRRNRSRCRNSFARRICRSCACASTSGTRTSAREWRRDSS